MIKKKESRSKVKLDKKKGQSFLHSIERKWIDLTVPNIPGFIESYHLTLLTILWSAFIIIFSYLARKNIHWLWGVSVMIIFQYITDSLDGSLGRYRKTGLIKWGFYMDHLLDFIFLASIMIGYAFLFPKFVYLHFFTLIVFTLFMVNSFLSLAIKGDFEITFLGFGPTEVRIMFIILNTLLIILGKTYLTPFTPYFLAIVFFAVSVYIINTQRELWNIDMKEKNSNKNIKSKKTSDNTKDYSKARSGKNKKRD